MAQIFWLFIGSEQPSHRTESSSQQGKARGTISPIPLMGSNKLGMAIGWSSTFETQTSVQGGTDEIAHEGTLSHSEEITCPITPTKLKNVPSFRTLLKDYKVQGPNRFEAPVYEESATPSMQLQQVFTLNKTTVVLVSQTLIFNIKEVVKTTIIITRTGPTKPQNRWWSLPAPPSSTSKDGFFIANSPPIQQ